METALVPTLEKEKFMGKNIHVVPSGNKWAVKSEGSNQPLSSHLTQKAASEAGRLAAQKNQSELVIHRPDGRIRDKDSFGGDPCPPRDTRH
jgi:hypothetical protein